MVFSQEILTEIPNEGVESKDILMELPQDRIDQFCETLKADWPLSIHAYYFIKTMSEWKIKKPSLKCKLLCVNPNDNLGTFVGILESDNGKELIIVYTLEDNNQQLESALTETSKIRWNANPVFEAVLLKHSQSIENAIRNRGKTPELYCNSTMYYASKETAAKFDIQVPDNVFISDLNLSDIDYMYSVWAHNDIYVKQELLDAVNFNRGVGVYSKTDGRLLSWLVHTHYGGIGNLQTRTGEGGKGYGKLIVKHLSKELSKIGMDVHLTIKEDNAISRRLFTSAGFEFLSPLRFIFAK
uniref:N-acetyltransferase domain-containing protein n=1 Tax=Cacopsylla melanoneura TaxID=428564 RepID=A0A8D9DUB2_9HEMI